MKKYIFISILSTSILLSGCALEISRYEHESTKHEKGSNATPSEKSGDIVSEFDSNGFVELVLDKTKPRLLRNYTEVELSDIQVLEPPHIVNLDNVNIIGNHLINKTPYSIQGLYLEEREMIYATFSKPLPPYSSAKIDELYHGYTVISRPLVSKSSMQFSSDFGTGDDSSARFANAAERKIMEQFLIYDQYMFNTPLAYRDVERFFLENCAEFTECENYAFGPDTYARSMYYAKAVSDINTHFIVDSNRWASASIGNLNKTTAYSDSGEQYILINPDLLAIAYDEDKSIAADTWQALAHVYYHNHGFHHDHGWASSPGVDDLFGDKVVYEYIEDIGNTLSLPRVVMRYEKGVKPGSYEVEVLTNSTNDVPLVMRILSTSPVVGRVVQSGSSHFSIEFDQIPENDVYLSIYWPDGQQMATQVFNFIKQISSQDELSLFSAEIRSWLNQYEIIDVKTSDGAWIYEFFLPNDYAFTGKKVRISSEASYYSDIIYGDMTDQLYQGETRTYYFDGASWKAQSSRQ